MKKLFSISLLVFCFSSCTPMQMALVGNDWQQKKELAVEGRNKTFKKQKLQFGDFETVEFKRSWTKGTSGTSGFGFGGTLYEPNYLYSFEHIDKKQTYQFKLKDGRNYISETTCATKAKAKDFTLGNNPNSPTNLMLDILGLGVKSENMFYARIFTNPNSQAWELFLDNQASQRSATYAGSLMQGPDNYYKIVPVNKVMGKNGPVAFPVGAVGFEFQDRDGKPVAAVSLIDKGMVYLRETSPEEQFLMANACAALLLQQADVL